MEHSQPVRRTLHMIGNAHLDPVWLWRWPEGLQAIRATFRSALDRMNETEEFVFTSSQAAMYEWIERTEPHMFEEIRQRVREGRWILVGGWWVQPDCNIPSGEGFVRQSLYGQRYFQEKFGVTATVGYNVDSFGHAFGLPQILKKSGMDYYVFMRPNPKENPDLPGRLWEWEGPDGSRVLTFQIPYAYNSTGGPKLLEKIEETAGELTDEIPSFMCFYGVGNHGGGPTKENIRVIQEYQGESVDLLFSDPVRYFREVEAFRDRLPVVRDDLQHHASGCYAAHSEIKRNNRRSEHALQSAEKLASAARELTVLPYPAADLSRAWKDVLFNHFHDILAGTSIAEAYEDALFQHGRALQIAEETAHFSLQAIAAQIDTEGEGTPIIVWNSTGHRQIGPVEVEWEWRGKEPTLVDSGGRKIPCQRLPLSAAVNPGGRAALLFMADVPATGYAVYRLFDDSPAPAVDTDLSASGNVLKNRWITAEFDEKTGFISRLAFRSEDAGELSVLSSAGAVPVVLDDPSDTWSHWVFRYDQEIGTFSNAKLKVLENGPVRATLQVTSTFGSSSLVQQFSLYADQPYLESRVTVDWHEQLKVLKLRFPVAVNRPKAVYEVPFGVIERPADGDEEPGLHWVDVSGDRADANGHVVGGAFDAGDNRPREDCTLGLTLVNDAKYSYDVTGSHLHLTVLRSPVYAHHDPKVLEEDEAYRYTDQGVQTFTYRLAPHTGGWQSGKGPRLGQELNTPLMAAFEGNHPGKLPNEWSLMSIDVPNVLLSAVKRAEDDDGTVVRVYEAYGQSCRARFTLAGRCSWECELGPFEVKSFHVSDNASGNNGDGVREIDLIERPIENAGR